MTATANETALDAAADVRFTPVGQPLAVRHEGRIWAGALVRAGCLVGHQENGSRGQRDLVSVEYWRVQVCLICPREGFPAMWVVG